jgi:hypothetical protein
VSEHEAWVATLTPAELANLQELGLAKPNTWDHAWGPVRKASVDDDSEFDDAADDAIAPIDLAPATLDQINLISDAFGRALVWATEAKSMVDMGWHLATMLKVMRPELLEGMMPNVPRDLEKGLRKALAARIRWRSGRVTSGCWPGVGAANHFHKWGSARSR